MVVSMRVRIPAVLAAVAALTLVAQPAPARADEHTDALSRCFVAATSEADRVAFVRWMFMAIAKHPQVTDLVNVTEAQRLEANRRTARLVERLVLTDCREHSMAVLRHDGFEAVANSFELVGETAAEGLMSHPAVAAQFDSLGQYIDQAAWEKFALEGER